MAIGQPQLLTWRLSDSIARIFQKGDSSPFVQIAAGGVPTLATGDTTNGLASTPFIVFYQDSQYLLIANHPTAGGSNHSVYMLNTDFSNIPNSSGQTIPNTVGAINKVVANSKVSGLILALSNAGSSFINSAGININHPEYGVVAGPPFADILPYSGTIKAVAIHPTDDVVFVGNTSTTSNFLYIKSGVASYTDHQGGFAILPTYRTPQTIAGINAAVATAVWTTNGQYLIVTDTAGTVYIYQYDSTAKTVTLMFSFTNSYGVPSPTAIDVSADDRYVCIGFNNSGTYTAIIYRRIGYVLQQKLMIANMGQLLNFTADGRTVIDSASKKAYTFDANSDQFLDNSTIMANLPAGVTYQAISTHTPALNIFGFAYNIGAHDIAARVADTANLKLMLLNSQAAFRYGDVNISQVYLNGSNNYEVSGQGWPTGGKLLTNVAYSANNANNNAALIADDVKQTLLNQLTFRYGVIYDATSTKPLLWIDFGGNYTTEIQSQLVISVNSVGIAEFVG